MTIYKGKLVFAFFCLLGMISIYVISNNCNALRTVFFFFALGIYTKSLSNGSASGSTIDATMLLLTD